MACEFEIVLNSGQYDSGTEIALDALDLVEKLESQLSYFRSDSEISEINRSAAEEPVPVEERLFSLLQAADMIYRETDGAFDLTATPLWHVWGFARGEGRLPSNEEIAQAIETVGGSQVDLDTGNRSVRFRKPGVELNLGSIGKGYALDRVAELLDAGQNQRLPDSGRPEQCDGQGAHDSAATNRTAGSSGWAIRSAQEPGSATSAFAIALLRPPDRPSQFFRHKGRRYSHIVDPRTGQPAEGVLSATVLAPGAAQADALATSFFVMGPKKAFDYCQNHPELGRSPHLSHNRKPGL